MRYFDAVREAPRILWAYAAVSLVSALVYLGINVGAHQALALGGLVFALLLIVLVLRGSRIAWSFVAASLALDLVTSLFVTHPWWRIGLDVTTLACLLGPPSLNFVWRRHPRSSRTAGEKAKDEFSGLDSDRPAGWYVDPSLPRQMRYWDPETSAWTGTTRTPRKIRRAGNPRRRFKPTDRRRPASRIGLASSLVLP